MSSLSQKVGQRPDLTRELQSVRAEIRKLWATHSKAGSGRLYDLPFSLPGKLYTTESGPWYPPNFGGKLVAATVGLRVPGETSTLIEIRMNGEVVPSGTIVVPEGQRKVLHQGMSLYVSGDSDYLTVAVTQAGMGAAHLNVQLRLQMH